MVEPRTSCKAFANCEKFEIYWSVHEKLQSNAIVRGGGIDDRQQQPEDNIQSHSWLGPEQTVERLGSEVAAQEDSSGGLRLSMLGEIRS